MTATQRKFHKELEAKIERMRSRLKRGTTSYPPKIEEAWDIFASYEYDLMLSYRILTEIYGEREVLRILATMY